MISTPRQITLAGTSQIIDARDLPIPFTVCLRSADVTANIQLCADNGPLEWYTPPLDVSTATQKILTVLSPVTHIKITGVANDVITITG